MKVRERVIIDPKVQHGKPVIRGTRVPVARIIAELAGGMSKEEIMHEYAITAEDVVAALAYAADQRTGESPRRLGPLLFPQSCYAAPILLHRYLKPRLGLLANSKDMRTIRAQYHRPLHAKYIGE